MDIDASSLTDEFRKRLLGFVRKRVVSDADADDVVQDVLTKLITSGPITGPVHAWLFTVARNAIIDRRRKRIEYQSLVDLDLPAALPHDDVYRELASCLDPMMSALTIGDQQVLKRIDMNGESQTDAAQELGISVSGMKSRVQRARERLRTAIESCCKIARDSRGTPIECEKRPSADCDCRCG